MQTSSSTSPEPERIVEPAALVLPPEHSWVVVVLPDFLAQ
jgi:hypothetical protein